ncbi:MAG: type II toxin-antitoxin system RelE/ParE family toxin [Clostridia bacterium]|nr:type II toxin-antitoxin system RelE/ParE family toxin [Clostridia bacterium]
MQLNYHRRHITILQKYIIIYILKDGESIAKNQINIIYGALENLALFPDMGKDLNLYINKKTEYKFIVIRKIYLAFYKVDNEDIEVIRILRGEQDYLSLLGLKD